MKKWTISIFSVLLLLGAGTASFAQTNMTGNMNWDLHNQMHDNGAINFDEMKPLMKEMHPNFSEQDLTKMYNSCHGE